MEYLTILASLVAIAGLEFAVFAAQTRAERAGDRRRRARRQRECLARIRRLREQVLQSAVVRSTEVQAGPVQLQGRVVARKLGPAPLSRKPVVGYRLRLERLVPGGGAVVVVDLAAMNSFELDDGGPSRVQVRPAGCLPLLAPEP